MGSPAILLATPGSHRLPTHGADEAGDGVARWEERGEHLAAAERSGRDEPGRSVGLARREARGSAVSRRERQRARVLRR